MLSREERTELENVCEAAKQMMRVLIEPIATQHPELSFVIEPRVMIDVQEGEEQAV